MGCGEARQQNRTVLESEEVPLQSQTEPTMVVWLEGGEV